MKLGKKLLVLLLALTMILSLGVTAFAADGDPAGTETIRGDEHPGAGVITINNAVVGEEYCVYQVLSLESYSITTDDSGNKTTHYAYKAPSEAWKTFFGTVSGQQGEKYFEVDAQGYVIWNDKVKPDEANLADVAKKAMECAKAIEATKKVKADSETVIFDGLDLGYYLVDTSLGTLCSLDTTDMSVTMEEKNEVPKNVKQVKEDSTNTWGSENHADIGQKVEFQSVITAYPGTCNLTFHDQIDEHFAINENDTIKVTRQFGSGQVTNLKKDTDYTVTFSHDHAGETGDIKGTCTFDIKFNDSVFANFGKAESCTIIIQYGATLNENANIGPNGNTNISRVSYGDLSHATPESKTVTRTFEFPVKKTDKKTGEGLPDTKFELCADNGGKPGTAISLVKITDGTQTDPNTQDVYRVAKTGEAGATTEIVTNKSGEFKIVGLDAGIHYLKETEAKAGYHKLEGPVKIEIEYTPGENGADGTVVLKQETANDDGTVALTPTAKVVIQNGSGTRLPKTGGIGTTIFYVLGGILTVGAVILLVAKRRMSSEK